MTHETTLVMYLDHAAATPLDARVGEAMQPYCSEQFFNPSSPYQAAVEVRREYENARASIARLLGVRPGEIVFTAGATESVNIAFESVLPAGSESEAGSALVAAIEHHSVLEAAKRHEHQIVMPNEKGEILPEAVRALITDATRIVSVALVNNELGTIQPLREIAKVVADERIRRLAIGNHTPIYLHTDASQAPMYVDVAPARLGVDLMTLGAGKLYGPKGVGLLWAAPHVTLHPLIVGGGQERGIRSGTENVAGVIGFAKAFELADKKRKTEAKRVAGLRDELQKTLTDAFDDAVVTQSRHRLANFCHIAWPGLDAERIIFMLEMQNVMVATGSACAANSGTRSHVLTAIGMPPDLADGSLRLTLGALNTEDSIKQAAELIIAAVKKERARTAEGSTV